VCISRADYPYRDNVKRRITCVEGIEALEKDATSASASTIFGRMSERWILDNLEVII
jgi:hypothetical protein